MICPFCNSTRVVSKGIKKTLVPYRRYKCKDCGKYHPDKTLVHVEKSEAKPPQEKLKLIGDAIHLDDEFSGIVVTSCLNDTKIFNEYFDNLVAYCKEHNFKLVVIKNKYLNPSLMNGQNDVSWPKECIPYFLDTTLKYKNLFKIIGDCNIQATATHPLTGIDGLSEGITTIVGHPVLQMKSLPVNAHKDPVILHSTGSVSVKNNYSATKAGYRASFHHCYGALVIELDKDQDKFFIRQLLADSTGSFHDLDEVWKHQEKFYSHVDAIYLGDEHVIFRDEAVSNATFGTDGIVETLKPKYILRSDCLDSHSITHHHKDNFFSRWKKHQVTNLGSIENELNETLDYIYKTTPEWSKSLLITGNHEEHLDKWLNIADPKQDLVNAKLYYQLMYLKLSEIENANHRTAFQLYMEEIYGWQSNVEVCKDGFTLHGINLSMHGDLGPNGARGSVQNLSKIGEKSVLGHSHSPSILGGAWVVGTSSIMNLEYVRGPSSWLHSHVIIHKNGKRQMITIINGKWKA